MTAALIACSSGTGQPVPPTATGAKPLTSVVGDTIKGSLKGAWQGVLSPLEDLGIKRQPIPEQLQVIQNPYAMPSPFNCAVISSEILTLNMLLGPDQTPDSSPSFSSWRDISMPQWQNRGKYMQQGSQLAQEQATNMARSEVSVIPYRSIVRKLSGADSHTKKVAEAYETGKLRRAFLKGISSNHACWY